MQRFFSISTLATAQDYVNQLLKALFFLLLGIISIFVLGLVSFYLTASPELLQTMSAIKIQQHIQETLDNSVDFTIRIALIYLAVNLTIAWLIKKYKAPQPSMIGITAKTPEPEETTKQPSDREIKQLSRFVSKLKTYVEDIGLDYEDCADHPLYDRLVINLSCSMEEEAKAYALIRRVRDCLSQSTEHPDYIEERYPVAVAKQWIASASCWSVTFYFSDEWKFKETLDFTFSNHYPVTSVDEHQSTITSLDSSCHSIEIIEDIVNMYDYATEQQKKDAIDECLRTSDMENLNIEHLHLCAKSYSVQA